MCQQKEEISGQGIAMQGAAQKEPQSLGKKMKQFREQRGITQSGLAEKLSVTRHGGVIIGLN